jgi:acyl dehydratase
MIQNFAKPLLQGLCTLGLAARALIGGLCEGDANRFKALSVRFSKPVFSDETLRVEMFTTSTGARLRARVIHGDLVLGRSAAMVAAA